MGIGTFVKPSNKQLTTPIQRGKSAPIDLILVAVVIALCIFGLLMVFSASTDYSLQAYRATKSASVAPYYIFYKQILLMIAGLAIATLLTRIDYHVYSKFAVPMMAITLGTLLAVLIFVQNVLGS